MESEHYLGEKFCKPFPAISKMGTKEFANAPEVIADPPEKFLIEQNIFTKELLILPMYS